MSLYFERNSLQLYEIMSWEGEKYKILISSTHFSNIVGSKFYI